MADWATIASMATAGGTLVLAISTFSAVRSSNRSARVAERSLLAGQRPILVPSREDDPRQPIGFVDEVSLELPGHAGAVIVVDGNVYMAIALRNGGAGLGVIHGWQAQLRDSSIADAGMPEISRFTRQRRDLYIPAGSIGFWQGAIRDGEDPAADAIAAAVNDPAARVIVDLLYSDYEGGQRAIARFGIRAPQDGEVQRAEVLRYWNVDGDDPRRG